VDAAQPPHIVIENPERCADAASAEDVLRRALTRARAPRRGWRVTMQVEPSRGLGHTLSAEGDVTDAEGTNVAHRFLSGSSASCAALARALGVWGSLVLDAELARASSPRTEPEPSPVPPPPSPVPTPELVDASSPDRDVASTRDEARPLDVGVGGFVMAQTAGRPYAGITPYLIVDVGHGLFLRPSAAFGESLPQAGPDAQWFAGRFDACSRWQGLYTKGHGLELTLCGGTEGGLTHDNGAAGAAEKAYLAVGPGIDLRGDIAENMSAVLRGVGGLDVLPQGWSGRFELALSWRMP
jgi:hypothetical protein